MKWLAMVYVFVAPLSLALEAIPDSALSDVSGQSGLTIETQLTETDGQLLSADKVTFSENDRGIAGDDTFSLSDLSLQLQQFDDQGNVQQGGRIITTIDVSDDGSVVIDNQFLGDLSVSVGALSFGQRALIDGLAIERFHLTGDSTQQVSLIPQGGQVTLALRNEFERGSGFRFKYFEDRLALLADVEFRPARGQQRFISELFVSANDDGLKLNFGNTQGSVVIRDINLIDGNGVPLFSAANYGDIGLSDIQVNQGYLTLSANALNGKEGLAGVINSDVTIGQLFYQTGDFRFNANGVRLNTNKELAYAMDIVDTGHATGVEMSLSSADGGHTDIDLDIQGLTLSDASSTQLNQPSFGGLSIHNLDLNQGSLETGIYTLPGHGRTGVRMDISAERPLTFELAFNDDDAGISADAEINNLSISQTIDQTKKGIHIGIVEASLDANVNAIRLGDGQTYQGQTGRLVINNLALEAGSYVRIEPLQ